MAQPSIAYLQREGLCLFVRGGIFTLLVGITGPGGTAGPEMHARLVEKSSRFQVSGCSGLRVAAVPRYPGPAYDLLRRSLHRASSLHCNSCVAWEELLPLRRRFLSTPRPDTQCSRCQWRVLASRFPHFGGVGRIPSWVRAPCLEIEEFNPQQNAAALEAQNARLSRAARCTGSPASRPELRTFCRPGRSFRKGAPDIGSFTSYTSYTRR